MRKYSTLIIFIVVVVFLIILFVGLLLSARGSDEITTNQTVDTTTANSGYTPPTTNTASSNETTGSGGTYSVPTQYQYRDLVTRDFINNALGAGQTVVSSQFVDSTISRPMVISDEFIMKVLKNESDNS